LLLLCLSGCVSGGSYPETYGLTYCSALFTCFEADSIEDLLGWDDVDDCAEDRAELIRDSDAYQDWDAGDADFDEDAAEECLDEVRDIESDPDCEGAELGLLSYPLFEFDAYTEECDEVYE